MIGQGDEGRAAALLAEGLQLAWCGGPRWLVAAGLEAVARLHARRGQAHGAVRLLGAAAALCASMGAPLWSVDQPAYLRVVATTRAALGEDAFTATWAAGAALPLAQAIDEAREAVTTTGGS